MESVTPDQMRRIEQASERLGISRLLLMENAGRSITEYLKRRFNDLSGKKVVVVSGMGNNGGDGFVAARHLAREDSDISVILLGHPDNIKTEEAKTNWLPLATIGKTVRVFIAPDRNGVLKLSKTIKQADIAVDAIFGTGVMGNLREPHSTAVDLINEAKGLKISVDIPSGMNPVSGEVQDKVISADVTITFHRPKTGLVKARMCVGELVIVSIGIPPEIDTLTETS